MSLTIFVKKFDFDFWLVFAEDTYITQNCYKHFQVFNHYVCALLLNFIKFIKIFFYEALTIPIDISF